MKKAILSLIVLSLCFGVVIAQEDRSIEYRITKNNLLDISVYNEPDLSKTVRVSAEGKISYPLLGDITVVGLTPKELEQRITDLLQKDYLVNPNVSVFVKEYAKIPVLGQVRNPGSYELKSGITVLDAIALSGGFTDKADRSKVELSRRMEGERTQNVTIDIDEITSGEETELNLALQPEDSINVPELGVVSVVGQVRSPGRYTLKDEMTVVDVIALAGGLTDVAAANGTKVIRTERGKKTIINVPVSSILKGNRGLDVLLKADDTIVVPESFF